MVFMSHSVYMESSGYFSEVDHESPLQTKASVQRGHRDWIPGARIGAMSPSFQRLGFFVLKPEGFIFYSILFLKCLT